MRADEFNDRVYRVRLLSRARYRGNLWSAETGLTMDVRRVTWWCDQRTLGAGEYGGADPKDVARDQSVRERARERRIAMHYGDPKELRVVVRHHHGEDIVMTRIAIHDHRWARGRLRHLRMLHAPASCHRTGAR